MNLQYVLNTEPVSAHLRMEAWGSLKVALALKNGDL